MRLKYVLMLSAVQAFVLTTIAVAEAPRSAAGVVTVTPKPTDEVLANPGVGWETFHTASRDDRSLPDWIPSTVCYYRSGWKVLEPRPGEYDFAVLDRILKAARDSGQALAFRVMCCSTEKGAPYHPSWLKDVGGKEFTIEYEGTPFPVPDLDDPTTLERHLALIEKLGERYDGHPDVAHVDLGSVGWWGEWHLSGKMPSMETQTRIVDAYLTAFKKTPILMLVGGGPSLARAVERGAGWRADCLGDMGGFSKTWCHMLNGYPEYVAKAGIADAWRKAPVAWETCWDMNKWVADGWSLRYIFNYALALHGSVINNKSARLPNRDDVRPEIERFLRRLGYRLVLQELTHPAEAKPGGVLDLRMKWRNEGSAPCYRPYRLAYRLSDGRGVSKVIVSSRVTADRWMPGTVEPFTAEFLKAPPDLPLGETVEESDRLPLPADLPPGDYELALAIVAEDSERPVVRLAVQGRAEDGWYEPLAL